MNVENTKQRLLPVLRLVLDAAALALVVAAAVDALRTWLIGAECTDPWVVTAGGMPLALVLGATILGRHLRASRPRVARSLEALGLIGLAVLALQDTAAWGVLRWGGELETGLPLPASLLFAVLLLLAVRIGPPTRAPAWIRVAAFGMSGFLLVLLHLFSFGETDYRRSADAVLVFGARVHADGRASAVLRDRTVTACELYETGWARHLVFSGGKAADAPLSEPEVMARIAAARGIPASAIVKDERGANTSASIRSLVRIANERGWHQLLAVSTDMHLARVRLLARRAGLALRTVPAVETVPWPKPKFVLRESLAWAWWYVRSVFA